MLSDVEECSEEDSSVASDIETSFRHAESREAGQTAPAATWRALEAVSASAEPSASSADPATEASDEDAGDQPP